EPWRRKIGSFSTDRRQTFELRGTEVEPLQERRVRSESFSANRFEQVLRAVPHRRDYAGGCAARPSGALWGRARGPAPQRRLDPERRARDRREDLLLVEDRSAPVCGHRRRVVRGGEQAVDIRGRDRKAEVIADEAAAVRAGIPRIGAGILREAVELLPGLLRI